MKRILFVCTGNTCRSPMAQALFNRLAASGQSEDEYQAFSAGLSAFAGVPASANAVKAMEDYPGADLSDHRARNISREDIDSAYLVLTMSLSHKQYILSLYPDAYQKVYTLKEYVYGAADDINDPYGGSEAVYRRCAAEIAQAVEKLAEKLEII